MERFAYHLPMVILVLLGCTSQDTNPREAMVFRDVNVLSMENETVLSGQTVVIIEDMIREIGSSQEIQPVGGATVIDATGMYLMPGLAEMHAHVPPGDSPPRDQVEDILFLYIANGVTTIRGMLGSDYQIPLAQEIERGDVLGPTFYVAAPSLSRTSAADMASAERLVREHKSAGYHLQKIHPGVPLEVWDHMASISKEIDLTFGGHVPADVGLVHAIETGISTVDHLDGYVQAVVSDDVVSQINTGRPINLQGLVSSVDESKINEIVQLSLENDVYVVPTLYLWENLYGITDPSAFLMQPEMKYVSAAQREAWRRQAAAGPRDSPDVLEEFFDLRKRILKALSDAGVGILMGTDSPQMFNVPGFALHRELELVGESGMSNYEILRSGTSSVARYVSNHLGLDGNFGTIAPGQRADLVLLGSNPLEDLSNLTDRIGVMVRGRWLPRTEIDEGLSALAHKHSLGN